MDEVEKEVLEATGFKPQKEYPDRQDYLAALARAVNDLGHEDFDQLSNEAVDWFNASAQALNDQEDLPDFDGVLPDEETDEPDQPEEASAAEADDIDEEGEEEPEDDNSVEEDGVDESPPTKKPKEKPAKTAKGGTKAKEKPTKVAKKDATPKKLSHPPVRQLKDPSEIEFDRFGLAIGTKNAAAAAMLVQGCRMADITQELRGTYYNMLRKLIQNGHKLEKQGNGILVLVHKDDIEKSTKRRK